MLDREEGIHEIKLTRKTYPIFDVNDIIESKRMEERLMKLNEALLGLGSDFDRNIQLLTETCGKLLGATCALYNRLENGMLYSTGRWQVPENFNPADKPDGHICYDVIKRGKEGRVYIVRNLPETHYFETDPNVARYGFRTYVGYPVYCFGQPVGSICAVYKEDAKFDENDRKIFEIFAKTIGVEEERKKTKETLLESEEKLRSIYNASPLAITVTDLEGNILECNHAALETHRFSSKDEVIGRSAFEFIAQKDRERAVENMKKTLEQGSVKNVEYAFLTKDGHEFPAELSAGVIRDSYGKPVGFVSITTNITEHKRVEEEREKLIDDLKTTNDKLTRTQQQLVHAEKLAAIGQLAAGVAHEINNPLTGVLGYSQRLLKKLESSDIDRETILKTFPRDLEIIKNAALRCERITKSLLSFARQAKLEMAPIDINETLEHALLLVENNLRLQKVNVVRNLQQDLPLTLGNPNAFQQVFTNLAVNARDAMPNGGTLTVTTRKENGNIVITFADTGIGIPKENLKRMFEPLFTTKSTDKGNGLGLSVAYGIIQEHKGSIEVESEVGKGATFRIVLPILNKTEKEVRING